MLDTVNERADCMRRVDLWHAAAANIAIKDQLAQRLQTVERDLERERKKFLADRVRRSVATVALAAHRGVPPATTLSRIANELSELERVLEKVADTLLLPVEHAFHYETYINRLRAIADRYDSAGIALQVLRLAFRILRLCRREKYPNRWQRQALMRDSIVDSRNYHPIWPQEDLGTVYDYETDTGRPERRQREHRVTEMLGKTAFRACLRLFRARERRPADPCPAQVTAIFLDLQALANCHFGRGLWAIWRFLSDVRAMDLARALEIASRKLEGVLPRELVLEICQLVDGHKPRDRPGPRSARSIFLEYSGYESEALQPRRQRGGRNGRKRST